MPHNLKNKDLELIIDVPEEGYNFSRFDWTGKIGTVKFQNHYLSVTEKIDGRGINRFGNGFCNEFGIDNALGFKEAKIGEWFHKIGIGLLRKNNDQYDFNTPYEIKPAKFITRFDGNSIIIECLSEAVNGYAYRLKKEISIDGPNFSIVYNLYNTGEKAILTDEYNHNFMAMNKVLMSPEYVLKFSFDMTAEEFDEYVNPEQKLVIDKDCIRFKGTPEEEFFFSNITGNQLISPSWELTHKALGIILKEEVDFQTNKINLWGTKHVICPELFHKISIPPGESASWSRRYSVRNTE